MEVRTIRLLRLAERVLLSSLPPLGANGLSTRLHSSGRLVQTLSWLLKIKNQPNSGPAGSTVMFIASAIFAFGPNAIDVAIGGKADMAFCGANVR